MKRILAIVLCMVMVLLSLPIMQTSAYTYERIYENIAQYFSLSATDSVEKFLFTPQESGYYKFFTISNEDTYVYCLDKDGNEVAFDDDNGYYSNCSCVVYLEKDKDYDFVVSQYEPVSERISAMIIRTDMYIQPIGLEKRKDISELFGVRSRFFEFVPSEDGYYAFYSEGDYDSSIYANLYDSNWNYLDTDIESGQNSHFYLAHYLKAGEKYYFEATHCDEESYMDPGSLPGDSTYPVLSLRVGVKKTEVVSQVNVTKYPDRMSYHKDYVEGMMNYSGLEAEIVFTDGRVEKYIYNEHTEIIGATVELGLSTDEQGKYFVYVMAGYGYTQFYLDISDVQVEKLTLVSPPTKVYVLGYSGVSANKNSYGEIVSYKLSADDIRGIEFVADLSDGTQKTFTDDDINVFSYKIDGYPYTVKKIDIPGSGIYEVELSYMGQSMTYSVEVLDKIELKGDVDRDNVVSVMDATLIQAHLAQLLELDAAQLRAADVTYDALNYNTVDIMDATRIQKFVAGLITYL